LGTGGDRGPDLVAGLASVNLFARFLFLLLPFVPVAVVVYCLLSLAMSRPNRGAEIKNEKENVAGDAPHPHRAPN